MFVGPLTDFVEKATQEAVQAEQKEEGDEYPTQPGGTYDDHVLDAFVHGFGFVASIFACALSRADAR